MPKPVHTFVASRTSQCCGDPLNVHEGEDLLLAVDFAKLLPAGVNLVSTGFTDPLSVVEGTPQVVGNTVEFRAANGSEGDIAAVTFDATDAESNIHIVTVSLIYVLESVSLTNTISIPARIVELIAAYFREEVDNEDSGTADMIDWRLGNKQRSTLTDNVTYTFDPPAGPTSLTLRLIQDTTGGRTATWPASVKWPLGTAPMLTDAPNAIDIVSFYFDGTDYYGVRSPNFS